MSREERSFHREKISSLFGKDLSTWRKTPESGLPETLFSVEILCGRRLKLGSDKNKKEEKKKR